MLGCPDCYEAFADQLGPMIERAQNGGTSHAGTCPRRGGASIDRHPAADAVVVGGADGVPKIYRIVRESKRVIGDDANLIRKMPALPGRVMGVAFSPDGKRVAAGSSLDGSGELAIYAIDFEVKPSPLKSERR